MNFKQMVNILMNDNEDSDYQYEVAQELAWYITPSEYGDGSMNGALVDWLHGSYQFTGNETDESLWDSWLNRNK